MPEQEAHLVKTVQLDQIVSIGLLFVKNNLLNRKIKVN